MLPGPLFPCHRLHPPDFLSCLNLAVRASFIHAPFIPPFRRLESLSTCMPLRDHRSGSGAVPEEKAGGRDQQRLESGIYACLSWVEGEIRS